MDLKQVRTMRATKLRLARPDGFTLMELVIVVGVIGFILGAVWYAASNAHESQRDTDAINELQAIVQNITSSMEGQTFQAGPTTPPTFYTGALITSQTIPTNYVNANGTTVDNPWNSGTAGGYNGLEVGIPNNKTFRVSFYNVSYQGCLALLTNGTSCQVGQASCPTAVYTGYAGTGPTTVPGPTGWTVMTMSVAQGMCVANSYSGGLNSVEFDYSLQ